MARWIRFYGKKRGHRRTGSEQAGRAGEALFWAGLLAVGAIGLVVMLVSWGLPHWQATGQLWLWTLLVILISFISIGGGGLVYSLLHWRTSTERRAALVKRAAQFAPFDEQANAAKEFPGVPRAANLINSPGTQLAYRLPIAAGSSWKLFSTALFCLCWNGIAMVFGVLAVNKHFAGQPDWLLDAFVVPCMGIGIWLLFVLLKQLLIATGVGPTLVEVSDHPLFPGKSYDLLISQTGRLDVAWIEVMLVCEEEACYQQGTDVRIEGRRVFEERLARCEDIHIDQASPFEQRCSLQVPHEAMHSFKADYNEIRWSIAVRGEAAGWPPLERSFPVVVYPATEREADA